MAEPAILPFDWADPFELDAQLTDEERMVRDTAEAYAQDSLQPRVTAAYLDEHFDREIMSEMGALGLLGATIAPEYGGAGLSYVSYGLIARAVERVDSGYRSAMSVQSSLVMHPINAYGSEEQTPKYLPKLATGEWVGCFGLTEPDAGSDPGGMRTRAAEDRRRLPSFRRQDVDHQFADRRRLRGLGQVRRAWRRDPRLRPREGHEGPVSAPKIGEKLSLRASITGEIVMDEVEVGEEPLLPNVSGLKGPFGCLNRARYGIAWGSMGAAEACFARGAQLHARPQAVRPPARGDPARPAEARQYGHRDHARAAGGAARRPAARRGRADPRDDQPDQAQQLRQGARYRPGRARHAWRQWHLAEFQVMRHAANLETVNTYEGTHDVHALILGRAITGIAAF